MLQIPKAPREVNYLRANVTIYKDNAGGFYPTPYVRKLNCTDVTVLNGSVFLSLIEQFDITSTTPGSARFYPGDIVPTGYSNSIETVKISVKGPIGGLYVDAALFNANFANDCNADCCVQPTCPDVTGIVISAVAPTTATATWAAAAPAGDIAGYEYLVNISATAPAGDGTFTEAITVPLTGLTTATAYHFWIRTRCANSDQSNWVSATFTTT